MSTPDKNSENKKAEKPFRSIGYRVHNELTYRGIDWALNTAVAVGFMYWGARTKSGQRYFNRPVSKGFETVLKPFLQKKESLEWGVKWGTAFTGMTAGGTFIIPPMMVLENKDIKKDIIHKIDETIYGKTLIGADPRFALQDKLIDAEPEKDFKTGMISRFAALTPFVIMASTPAIHVPLLNHVYRPVGRTSRTIANKLNLAPKRMLIEGAYELGEESGKRVFVNDWDFVHRAIGFDLSQTLGYAYVHEFFYKMFAKDKQRHDDHFHGNQDLDNTFTLDEVKVEGNHLRQINRPNPRLQELVNIVATQSKELAV